MWGQSSDVVERMRWEKGRKLVERVQMDCSTQIQSAERSKGSPGVARTAAAVAVVAEGVIAVAAVDVTIPLAAERVGVEPVVAPVILVVDAATRPVVEPIGLAWLLVELAAAKG